MEAEANALNLKLLGKTLAESSPMVYHAMPDVVTDAALLLWSLLKSLMATLFEPTPDPVPLDPTTVKLVTLLLSRLHVTFDR